MMLSSVIFLAAVFALLAWQKARGKAVPISLLAAVGVAALALALWRAFLPAAPAGAGNAIGGGDGTLLGKAVAGDIPAGGDLLVILAPDLTKGLSGIAGRQIDSLAAAAGGKFRVIKEDAGERDPRLTPELCRSLLGRHPGVCAIVSFAGLPTVAPGEWPVNAPPLYVFGFEADLQKDDWRQSDRLKALVTFRKRTADGAASPAGSDALYERVK